MHKLPSNFTARLNLVFWLAGLGLVSACNGGPGVEGNGGVVGGFPDQIDITVDFAATPFTYFPQGGAANLAYCPIPSALPANTTFQLISADIVQSTVCTPPSSPYQLCRVDKSVRDVTPPDGLTLGSNASGGFASTFTLPYSTDWTGGANYNLSFAVTLPATVDPTHTAFNYTLPVQCISDDQGPRCSVITSSNAVPALTPHPGDCATVYPLGQLLLTNGGVNPSELLASNDFCNGVLVSQVWPSGAQLLPTGAAVVTTDSGTVTIPEIVSSPAISINADGSYLFNFNLNSPTEISDPTQVTAISFPAQIAGVPALAGQTFQVTLDSAQYFASGSYDPGSDGSCGRSTSVRARPNAHARSEASGGTGGYIYPSNGAGTIVFWGATLLPLPNAAPLCAGAACLDGSTVVSCPVYKCVYGAAGASAGTPPPSPMSYALTCGSACLSYEQQEANCAGSQGSLGSGGSSGGTCDRAGLK